jgi:hypothetical protein
MSSNQFARRLHLAHSQRSRRSRQVGPAGAALESEGAPDAPAGKRGTSAEMPRRRPSAIEYLRALGLDDEEDPE